MRRRFRRRVRNWPASVGSRTCPVVAVQVGLGDPRSNGRRVPGKPAVVTEVADKGKPWRLTSASATRRPWQRHHSDLLHWSVAQIVENASASRRAPEPNLRPDGRVRCTGPLLGTMRVIVGA